MTTEEKALIAVSDFFAAIGGPMPDEHHRRLLVKLVVQIVDLTSETDGSTMAVFTACGIVREQ